MSEERQVSLSHSRYFFLDKSDQEEEVVAVAVVVALPIESLNLSGWNQFFTAHISVEILDTRL